MKIGTKSTIAMKKNFYIITAAALSLVACSRNQEIDVPDANLSIFARTESPADTKTVVESGVHVYWEPGDEIAVFTGEQSAKFTTDITAASGTATFKGTFGDVTWPEDLDLWAVYPFSEDAVFDGETITTTLPSEQVAREGSFGKDMNLAIAHSNSSTLQFYNVGGGIRFSVTEEGIKKVIFEGLSGEFISGKVKIGMDENGKPEVREVTGGSQFITLLPPSGQETFEPGGWYYIVAIPGSLEGGYKLRFYKDSDYARRVSEKKVEIKRSVFGSLEKADSGIEYEATTIHFPTTEEECKESVALTYSIQKEVTDILWVKGEEEISDIKAKIEEISMVEGVIYVDTNSAGTCISVVQKDSVCVNYLLYNPISRFDGNSEPNALPSMLTQSRSHSSNTVTNSYFKDGKKALIIAPFQWDFNKRIESVWIPELSKNYSPENIMYLPNSKAEVFKFKEELSKQYDFILIDTHGVTGKRSRITPSPFQMESAFLATATRYNLDVAWQIISSHDISSDEVAYCSIPNGDTFVAINPKSLEDASYNDNCVIITACESAMMLNNKIPWFDAFTSKGSCVVSGATVTMKSRVLGPLADHLIEVMTLGCSFKDAFKYVARSQRMRDYCNAVYELVGADDDFGGFDVYNNYIYKQNENKPVLDFFLTNPIALLNSPVINAENTSLSWEASSYSFPATLNIATSAIKTDGKVIVKYEPITFNQTFDVYVDGKKISTSCFESGDNTKQIVKIPNPSIGLHSWKVITNIIEVDTGITLGSYASEEDYFSITQEITYETPEAIDLGLSVKWASFNLGAAKKEDFGYYYAWGETEPKDYYDWANYKWGDAKDKLTKYVSLFDTENSYHDGKYVLELPDDAAYVNLGKDWRMPSMEEWYELRDNCTWEWTTEFGVGGQKVTSKKNGKYIFLPAAGYAFRNTYLGKGSEGDYWGSSFFYSTPVSSSIIDADFGENLTSWQGSNRRCYGLTIRPVQPTPVTQISLDQTHISLYVGADFSNWIRASTFPLNASHNLIWSVSDHSVLKINPIFNNHTHCHIVGLSPGTVTVTVTALDGGISTSCRVDVVESPLVTEPMISANPTSLDYGDVKVGTTVGNAAGRVEFTNIGGGDLIINHISCPDGFSHSPSLTFPITISPGDSKTITFAFKPTETKTYSGYLKIYSNSWRYNPFEIQVTGNGIE